MIDLSAATTFINLLTLASSVWLGFYILTRSPYSAHSRLAALMLWSLDSYFLCNTLLGSLPGHVFLAWLQQEVILALPLTLHLSVRLLPPLPRVLRQTRLNAINRVSVPLAYVAAVVLIAFGVLPSNPPVGLFNLGVEPVREAVPLGYMSRTTSPLYPVFLVFLVLVSALALINLWNAREQTRRRSMAQPFTVFFAATALAGLGAVYAGIGTWLHLNIPTVLADLLFGVSIVLVGYAVARYAALLEGRPMDRDFLYAILVVGSLTAFYALIVLVLYLGGQVSFVTLVLTIIGTIAANSLFDGVRIALDRVFYQSQFQKLRGNLRALAREAGTSGTLSERLQAILATLCRVYRIRKGFIALRGDDQWIIGATHGANPIGHAFDAPVLTATESIGLLHTDKKGLPGMLLLIPLFGGGCQIGAVVLGAKESKQPYDEADLELLEDLGDEIAAMIHAIRLQEENAQTINAMVQDFREKERALQMQVQQILSERPEEAKPAVEGMSEEELIRLVEDALRRLYDFSYLGEQALARFRMVESRVAMQNDGPVTFIDRGKAINEVLLQALEKLRPEGTPPGAHAVPPREWHQYIILHDSYVLGELNRDIMSKLYIGEGSFNRTRRRALRSVAKALEEMEQAVQATGALE